MIAEHGYDIFLDDVFVELGGFITCSRTFLKIEGLNPAGSIKLKTARALVADFEDRGLLAPGGRIIESSSGNLGIALSMVCTAKRYRLTIVTDVNASTRAIRAMRALGTRVLVIEEADATGGFLHQRIERIHRELAADHDLMWLNQYANRANVRAHRDQTARSIHENLGRVDILFVGSAPQER